jgi:hypothetical protein
MTTAVEIVDDVDTIAEVAKVIQDVGITICDVSDTTMLIEKSGILVAVALTEDARLRFSANIHKFDGDVPKELLFALLDLNTEIDPVSVAIDSINPNDIQIQARTALRVGDIQEAEVVAEIDGLVYSLPTIAKVIKTFIEGGE